MIDEIVIEEGVFRQRVALLSEGLLYELLSRREDDPPGDGDIYLARVGRHVASVGGRFVDIGAGRDALLPDADADDGLSEGARVIVQVRRAAMDGKGARVSGEARLPGRYLVLAPGTGDGNVSARIDDEEERRRLQGVAMSIAEENAGVTIRTAAAGIDEELLRDEAAALAARWRQINRTAATKRRPGRLFRDGPVERALRDHLDGQVRRILVDAADPAALLAPYLRPDDDRVEIVHDRGSAGSRHDLDAQVAQAQARDVELPGGGSISIETTRALTAIDVNAAGRGAGGDAEQTWLEANLAAAAEIARQIRLRDIGGQIVVDFINMRASKNREKVLSRFRRAFRDDPANVRIADFSEFGLVELSRRRRGRTLAERLGRECEICDGTGRRPNLAALSDEVLAEAVRAGSRSATGRVTVVAAPQLVEFLNAADPDLPARVFRHAGVRLDLTPDSDRGVEDFAVTAG